VDTLDSYSLSHKRRLHIVPLGDFHVGARNCNYDYLEYAVNTVKNLKGPKRVYLLGDLMETADRRVGNSVFEQDLSIDDQILYLRSLLKPIKDDIVFLCRGNHEDRLIQMYDLDLTRILANSFDAKYGYQCHDVFKINDKEFQVMAYHGKGRSRNLQLAYGKVLRELGNFQADLYIYGHLHMTGSYREFVWTGRDIKQKTYILTGHFMKYWGGYPESKALSLSPESFMICGVNKSLSVDCNPFFIHERRNDLLT